MNSKICTSIEQSKKLIELGLDVETSDMFYWYGENIIRIGGNEAQSEYFDVPAWSLSSLLGLMPFHIIEDNVRYEFQIVKGLNKEGGTYKIKYKGYTSLFETIMYNNPIDAAFEMIVWLLENKKI